MNFRICNALLMMFLAVATPLFASDAAESPRARDLGVPFGGIAGPLNAITDVDGVEVGHVTLFTGNGALRVGEGPVRTGVTVVHPRGKNSTEGVFGGWFTLNASGEMTGTTSLTFGRSTLTTDHWLISQILSPPRTKGGSR